MTLLSSGAHKPVARQAGAQPPMNNSSIAPWDDPHPDSDSIAPWDTDPQSQIEGIKPFGKDAGNGPDRASQASFIRPATSRTTTESPDYEGDRRPSVVSSTSISSSNSRASGARAGFHKSLKGFFGDDPGTDSRKGSQVNVAEQGQNGGLKGRNDSSATEKAVNDDRPHTPLPSSDVTPWAYQNFEDVSNFGAAPVRPELLPTNNSSHSLQPGSSNGSAQTKRGLLHRHTRSKEEPAKSQPMTPSSQPQRPTTSRESSNTNLSFARQTPQNTTPMSSSVNINRSNSPTPGQPRPDKSSNHNEKRSIFSKLKHRHKDKPPEPPRTSNETARVVQEPPKKRESQPDTPRRNREESTATFDSASTVKAEEFPKMERTTTASSKMTGKFSRHPKARGMSYQSEASDKTRQSSQPQNPIQAGIFNLDTNFDDMSDILAQPSQPKTPGDTGGIFTGMPPGPQTPAYEPQTPAWDAPDSWAVKGQGDEVLGRLPEVDESGLPAIEEEDGVTYFMRVFRTDSTFATLSTTVNATVADILQMLAKKSVLHDDISNYALLLRKHDLSRQLDAGERPIAMQKKLLQQAGYNPTDRIEEIGREDNSYLCRFTFSHEKLTGFGSGLDKDPTFNKMQKFSHVDLQGKSLVTIPITLYTKAPEIISLNLSRNLSLSVPKDFITACINLREIKFTANEAWRLPASLSWASRLTVLDISNNRLENLDTAELNRLTSLVSIKLANNKLSKLPAYFANFRQLRSLNISSNSFTTFPEHITGLRSLVDLDISFNKLSSLPTIGNLTTLERLWTTNNDLKGPFDDSWGNLVNLKEIDARFNGITNIDNVAGLPNLEQLLVGHNAISTFKGSFPKLRTLILDHCPMTSFDLDAAVPTLSVLNIASAKLVEFKESMFDYMCNLQKLTLDKNHFSHISPNVGRLSRLEYLSIAKNPLNVVPPSIGNLTELKLLNLRECSIGKLPPEIWYCLKLETLILSSNVLETFPKQGTAPPPNHPGTTTPSLSSSPSFEELGKLEDFQARRPSQVSTLHSTGTSPISSQRKNSLASLYGPSGTRKPSVISRSNTEVSFNPVTRKDSNLSQVRFQNTFAGSLRYLYLADNRLEEEVFRELVLCPELRVLNLSYNSIDDFPQGALKRWPQLTELYLSGNELTSLPSEDFEESSNLKTLHLNANRFQVLPAELCNVHRLSILDVGSNSLKYNVSNWPYDWNWNRNTNLKYLNFSANKRLEIKPAAHHNQNNFSSSQPSGSSTDLTSFSSLKYLRVLGLMDVTLLIDTVPEDSEDRRVRTSASLAGSLMYGMADTLGKNEHLSTLDLLKPNFRGHDAEVLIGMFDGQTMSSGGSKIAKYLHENFSTAFVDELAKLDAKDQGPIDALRRTFLSLNKDMANAANQTLDAREHRLSNARSGSITGQILSQDDLTSGGVATILYLNGTDLFVANVGDAEAILIQSNTQHKVLTFKHDPAEPRERERIRDAGGYVSRQGKLNDALEVSRAFGYFQQMPCVIAAPHTLHVQLTDADELIVLASKEFWDFVTPDLAVDIAKGESRDLMIASAKLRDLAMAYGARDKIMVMVMGISELRKRGNHRFRGTSLSMAKELSQEESQLFPSSRRTRRKGETMVGDSRLARLEEPEAPIGDVAIVFTDIKNSTALWEILPVPMRSGIMMHNELMRRQLRIIGGYEVKTEGDAFMVSFPTVTSALLWCFSCQSHLLELPWSNEILETTHCQEKLDADGNVIYRGLSVRMGIHWGRPVCEQDPITRRMDYFGPMVNKAARVSAVADGGQIAVSSDYIAEIQRTLEAFAEDDRRDSVGSQDTVNDDPMGVQIRRELRQLSSQGFEVKDLGEKKLKGLENPEFIYLMYPHILAGRLTSSPGGPPAPEPGAETKDPGMLGKNSELESEIGQDAVWQLWNLALRLEMFCSALETPEKAATLNKPELSLLNKMRHSGGEITDQFMMNLLEHQVTRIEVSRDDFPSLVHCGG
jgi:adenylate cyclase